MTEQDFKVIRFLFHFCVSNCKRELIKVASGELKKTWTNVAPYCRFDQKNHLGFESTDHLDLSLYHIIANLHRTVKISIDMFVMLSLETFCETVALCHEFIYFLKCYCEHRIKEFSSTHLTHHGHLNNPKCECVIF